MALARRISCPIPGCKLKMRQVSMHDWARAAQKQGLRPKDVESDERDKHKRKRMEDGWVHLPSLTKFEAVQFIAELRDIVHPKEG